MFNAIFISSQIAVRQTSAWQVLSLIGAVATPASAIATYQAGETVFAAGSRSGQLLILKSGGVAIVKGDIEIAKVREPGRPRFGNVTVSCRGCVRLARETPERPPLRCSDPRAAARQCQSRPH
jgi:hypothetical protein